MTPVLQLLLTAAACVGLWRLWRSIAVTDRSVAMIVTAGFLIRVVGGQVLFWTSWLHLPLARSLQVGDGLWFYALDAQAYLLYAEEILRKGPTAVFFVNATYPSHFFVQVLTIAVAAFGRSAAMGILLNAFAYLITCLVVVRLADPRGPARAPCLVALAALALGPGAILWSLQPLKDSVLTMLAVVMVGACHRWQAAWREAEWTDVRWRSLTAAAGMLAVMYAISGIRWYFGAILWAASGVFLALTAFAAPRTWAAATAAAALFVVLSQSFRFGGADDITPWVRRQLDPRMVLSSAPSFPIVRHLTDMRRGFESAPGATTIAAAAPPTPSSTATAISPAPAATPAATPSTAGAPRTGAGLAREPSAVASSVEIARAPAAAPVDGGTRRRARALGIGLAALVLPVSLGRMLGILHVGGGRNLWLFVDLATIALDLVLLFAIWYCGRHLLRRRQLTPLFVMVAIALVATAVPMAYTVTNFGTLFRLREMVYTLAAVLPLTLAGGITDPPRPPDTDA